jgi:hypothetical protein
MKRLIPTLLLLLCVTSALRSSECAFLLADRHELRYRYGHGGADGERSRWQLYSGNQRGVPE